MPLKGIEMPSNCIMCRWERLLQGVNPTIAVLVGVNGRAGPLCEYADALTHAHARTCTHLHLLTRPHPPICLSTHTYTYAQLVGATARVATTAAWPSQTPSANLAQGVYGKVQLCG